MAEKNKSYRIRTTVGREADSFLEVHLDQDYDTLEILSLKLSDKDTYKLHNSDYGVVVGRVLANGNFGVPNAKISVFIPTDEQNENMEMWNLYPYTSTSTKNEKDIRYNLLPDESVKDCHKAVGTFPHKTYLLENDALLEVFDKYYVYTTRTNAAGDYLICGVPTGMQTLHMDLDLSDCGVLSQRPRDFVYKGYTIEQFENPNQFKKDENIDGLSQIFTQNQPVYVKPFWGNQDNGEEIGITRADIQIAFKFEPTCVFMGSAISDNASNGVGKKCVPTNQMGAMDELTAGEGTIEMIRKTPGGHVEEFAIKGNQLINGNGVWCYQIPMNLDYMMTDEYGNMVPTDDPEKGIPTRARVRFRASLTDMDGSSQSYYRAKYLIPNNPAIEDYKVDYNFGTYTDESSYRDLFWNGVYTVKSYIPRFQKSKRWRNERFSGIKACNYYGGNNPMPYNNLRIKLPFMFTVLCIFVKLFIKIVTLVNRLQTGLLTGIYWLGMADRAVTKRKIHCSFIGDGLCPDMEGWYFAPGCANALNDWWQGKNWVKHLKINTLYAAIGSGNAPDEDGEDAMNSTQYTDETSIDNQNTTSSEEETACLTMNVDYLVNCFEMNLANEYRVIKFDFYNDWVNGVLYFPRWMRKVKRKKKYKIQLNKGLENLVTTYYKDKVQGCMNSENSRVKKSRYYTQQCSLGYTGKTNEPWVVIKTPPSCNPKDKSQQKRSAKKISIFPARCHKKNGMTQSSIFGRKSGLVTEETTMLGQFVYYLKPCEWKDDEYGTKKRTLLFATDIVLLGTLNDCDENGIPQAFRYLNNTSYIMPTNLALTTMDDDSYIYSNGDGNICLSSNSKIRVNESNPDKNFKDSVRRITPDYESTYNAYSRTENDVITYGENDDAIAVTEAAGINWNYSGPGQDDVLAGTLEKPDEFVNRLFEGGNKKFKYLYYPGGHFLGLSCVNSETNIKSCVNLKRICELGATMSQRREELRGYDENNGSPKFRYYVPTGLITNVDIETATFRSMFATLNHNKLVANETNEKTGYKKYTFRFLRPDGFDGSLTNYVHMTGSPYNRRVNKDTDAVKDNSDFLRRNFPDWAPSEDYDPQEAEFTETRTIEDCINDYYMFRFGVDNFTNAEQRKHYLVLNENGYNLPQYENSFYFYFGLKDGSTALDEFKKQFFSECEPNNIMKTPTLTVSEKILLTENNELKCSATLLIDNMVPSYTITFKDNTDGSNEAEITTEKDLLKFETTFTGVPLVIGHEYTVTVTDSLDQTATKTFVFGASVVKVNAQSVHFRKPGSQSTTPNEGGYIKISDKLTILKKELSIQGDNVNIVVKNSAGSPVSVGTGNYIDAGGEKWMLYYPPATGKYDVFVNFYGNEINIYSTELEDNTTVELYVGCDYFGYKSGQSLKDIPASDWYNNSGRFVPASSDGWLYRHTYYRQTQDDTTGYDSVVYGKGKGQQLAIFGQPEQGNLVSGYGVLPETFNKDDYESFQGYAIDETWSYIPSLYWKNGHMDPESMRRTFDAMAYTIDGRAAADNSGIIINGCTKSSDGITLTTGGGLEPNHGYVVVFENGVIVFPVAISETVMKAYHTDDPYEVVAPGANKTTLLKMATVYPTLRVPVIYKPFFGEVSAATWNLTGMTLERNDEGISYPKRVELPISYKVEGIVHNGLTYGNNFYLGERLDEDPLETIYDTYMVFPYDDHFYNEISQFLDTSSDFNYDRKFRFGEGEITPGFFREVDGVNENIPDTDVLSYRITEGFPDTIPDLARTGRYEEGLDLYRLEDECNLSTAFYTNLRIRAFTSDGAEGQCCLYSDTLPDSSTTKLFYTTNELFKDFGVLSIADADGTTILSPKYCYGYYNKNAEYDEKGAAVKVLGAGLGPFTFGKTQANGSKLNKTVLNERKLYDEGVTLQHKFNLRTDYASYVSGISFEVGQSEWVHVATQSGETIATNDHEQTFSTFSQMTGGTLIAEYVKQPDGSKNHMVVYKLFPVKALEVVFPADATGLAPFISVPKDITCSYEAQTVYLTVAANVHFMVSINGGNWAKLDPDNPGPYDPDTTTLKVIISANTGTSSADRYVDVVLTTEGAEDLMDENGNPLVVTATCRITQLKDDVAPVAEAAADAAQAADDAQAAADRANQRINDLEPDNNNG